MKITDLLDPRSISLDAAPTSKSETLDKAVELMAASGKLSDVEAFRKQVYAREEESTTGIGEGIAIPHGKCDAVKKPGLAAMVIKNGVDFDSLDGEPVTLLFLIAAPNTKDNVHLDVLSKLSVLMMDEHFSDSLRNASSVEDFLSIIDKADAEQAGIDERLAADSGEEAADTNGENAAQAGGQEIQAQKAGAETEKTAGPKILAVTSCPTGIAHTYMAAEGLEKAARAKGWKIKVETRGSAGAKNVLTAQEIEAADCIIVAADAQVPMDRFDGKRVIECQVSDGISKAPELLERAASGEVPVYHAASSGSSSPAKAASGGKSGSVGHQIYTQLMNGVSHMLPFVVGGGILIAIAFLIDGFSVDMNALPLDQRVNFGTITPLAAWFKNVGGVAFGFMLPILAGFIAMAIGDRPALAVGFVGGMIASQGKSGFLGALAAGFIAGYLILALRKACENLPEALEKIAPVLIYPVVGVLLIGLVMSFVVEPVMGAINMALNNGLSSMGGSSKLILGFVLAAMMAIDMGGPFNKAAYVFGTAALSMGQFDVMAAVMIGGMVPPIAIALSCTFFPKKWTTEERNNGLVNYVMGLCFISEGAIPYAAADPGRVLPSCIIGSAIAGGLSMAFGCTLQAPHGGIFVFPTVGHPLMYVVALLIGSIVGAVILSALKKTKAE